MKRLTYILLLLSCLTLPAWAQDVMDISWLHDLANDTNRVDSSQVLTASHDTVPMQLPDSVVMTVDKQDTVIVIHGLLDSINAPATLDEDAILLELVARQSQLLHANDTIWEEYPHPLCMELMYIPVTFPPLT